MKLRVLAGVVGVVTVILGVQPFFVSLRRRRRSFSTSEPLLKLKNDADDDTPPYSPTPPSPQQHKKKHSKNAHIVVLGNEKYLEGALVMGWGMQLYKKNDIDLICLATQGRLGEKSLTRLRLAGWDRVIEADGMTKRVGKSNWKDSFVKLHIFNFTEYNKVAYWDSDMALHGDPNGVFGLKLPKNDGYPWLLAIGNPASKGKKYFQTGMMVFKPSERLKTGIWSAFSRGLVGGKKYNSLNSRDGMVLRDFFDANYSTLPKKYSRNIDPRLPLEGVVGVHYRGGWKPWFNKDLPMVKRTEGPLDDTKKDFGHAYLFWWKHYEQLHNYLHPLETAIYPPSSYPPGTSPTTHAWVLRETPESYTQPLFNHRENLNNISYPGVSFVLGIEGDSCDATCAPAKCHGASLMTTVPNTCEYLKSKASCKSCGFAIYTKARNGSVFPGHVTTTGKEKCFVNIRLDGRGMPGCGAADSEVRRLCPCGPT